MNNFPEAPKTDIEVIENSPHKEEIFAKLLSGWSPARIVYWMYNRYGKTGITITEVLQFARAIPEDMWLESSKLDAKFHGIDIELDAITEMHRVLRFAKSRLDDALLLEGATTTTHEEVVERRARLYWSMLMDFGKLAAASGILVPETVILPSKPNARVRLRDVVAQRKRIIAEQTDYTVPADAIDGEFDEVSELPAGKE